LKFSILFILLGQKQTCVKQDEDDDEDRGDEFPRWGLLRAIVFVFIYM